MRNRTLFPFVRALVLSGLVVLAVACGSDVGDVAEPSRAGDSTATPTTTTTTPTSTTREDQDHDDHDHDSKPDGGADAEVAAVAEVEAAQRRLVAAAVEGPALELLDFADGTSSTLELEAPASLGSAFTADGRYLLTAHPEAVGVVDTGVWSERHGDHYDHYAAPPEVLGYISGPRPSHLVSHDGTSALYFDGTGEAVLLDEAHLARRELRETGRLNTGAPHHGFSVPTGDHYFVTVPTPEMEELPNLVGVADADGQLEERFDCPLVHGETGLTGGAAAACTDGIMVVTIQDETWTGAHLAYPEVDDEDPYGYGQARAWILIPSSDSHLLAAPFGARHLLAIDPETGAVAAHDLGRNVATLGVGIHNRGVVVLSWDGSVSLVDPDDGTVTSSVEAITPFEEGDPAEPYRMLVVSNDHGYVSDPASDQVVEVSLGERLVVERVIDLGVTPSFIGVANG